MRNKIEDILSNMDNDLGCEGTQLETDEKKRIYNLAMSEIEKETRERTSQETETKSQGRNFGEQEAGKKTSGRGIEKKGRMIKHHTVLVVLAAVLAFGLVACAVAYHYSDAFRTYFGSAGDDVKISGTVLLAEESFEGVTVRAKEVVGDSYGCYIYYQIEVKDIEDWQLPEAEEVSIELPATSYTVLDPAQGAVNGNTADFIIGVRTSENLQGMKCKFTLSNPGYYDASDRFVPFCEHDFSLSFDLNYEDVPTEIDVNKEISIYGGKATFDKISISPLSVTVFLTETEQFKREASELPEGESVNDQLTVRFMDGSIRDSYCLADDYDIFDDTTVISMGFHKMVSLDDIENITFAGVTVPITENKNPVEDITYENQKLGICIDMPQPLYDLIKPADVRMTTDEEGQDGAYAIDFVGEKDGVSMLLFTVYRLDGEITQDELEDMNPFMTLLASDENYTYTILYGEIVTQEQLDIFADIMNQYTANVKERIQIIPYTLGKMKGTGTVNTDTLKVRKEAQSDADTIHLLPEGEKVEIIGVDGKYYNIRFDTDEGKTQDGYVLSKYIKQ